MLLFSHLANIVAIFICIQIVIKLTLVIISLCLILLAKALSTEAQQAADDAVAAKGSRAAMAC